MKVFIKSNLVIVEKTITLQPKIGDGVLFDPKKYIVNKDINPSRMLGEIGEALDVFNEMVKVKFDNNIVYYIWSGYLSF